MPCYRLSSGIFEQTIMAWTKNCLDINSGPQLHFIHTRPVLGANCCNPWDFNRGYWHNLTDLESAQISEIVTEILIQLDRIWGDSSKSRYDDLDI